MAFLEERTISCPYCGESIDILIDPPEQSSVDEQGTELLSYDESHEYIEDCQVCCRPIRLRVGTDNSGESVVQVFHENE